MEAIKNSPFSNKFLKILPFSVRKKIPYYKYQYLKDNQFSSVQILTDDPEFDTTNPDKDFNFKDHSKAIVSMINGTNQKFSVGIYGEWGTGKTTLMKLIERDLRPIIFNWHNIPGSDSIILKNFLQKNFDGLNKWINNPSLDFEKSHDRKRITISSDNTEHPKNYLSITLVENRKAILEINHQKVYEFFVEKEEDTSILVKENNILVVWFNAWRYEREEQFALIPLMKTIAYAMGDHPIYNNIKPILIRGLEILSKDILRNLATRYVMTEEGFKEFEEKLIPKLEKLPEIDKDTIYFDGIKKVEDKIREISQIYTTSRIVVFIDDLDRCSPETALEVFESVKIFFEIDGFVFIIGLSRETLYKLIKAKYEKMGLSYIPPQEYIRKMIQIDINIQKWTDISIKELIDKLSYKIDKRYRQQITTNSDLIAKGVELNPRQVKRFLNRLVIALNINNS
jgi:KAP family P-loop domain